MCAYYTIHSLFQGQGNCSYIHIDLDFLFEYRLHNSTVDIEMNVQPYKRY